jgi:16S rRNA (uracil1498-N3)-methyltransferase
LCADPGSTVDVTEALTAPSSRRRVLLAVGPEGGWTGYERRMFERCGFTLVSMGPRTLRSDTACIALLALAHAGVRLSPHPATSASIGT